MATKNEETQMNYENTNEATSLHIGSVPPSFETSEDTDYTVTEQPEDESAAAQDKRRKIIRNSAIGVGGGALLVGGIAALWANNANADESDHSKKAASSDKEDGSDDKVKESPEVVPLDDDKEPKVSDTDKPEAGKESAETPVHEAPVHETASTGTSAASKPAAADTTAAHTHAEHVSHADAQPADDSHSWAKNDISVSEDVTDDMSFADAYETARAEVGAGGVFVWHGDVYSTYTADEWDALTPVERTQYAQNFDWNQLDSKDSPVYDPAHPAWVDGDITVATGVNDDMTFSEAFAAARAEVGAGGAFVWHGQVYGTYNAAEWNQMTAAERAEFAGHFDWNQVGSETSDVQSYAQNTTEVRDTGDEFPADVEPEVEVHGVYYDEESGMTAGHMTVDGENVVFVDVDNDGTFDVAAVDINHDGELQDNEIHNISDANVTVQDMAEGISVSHEPAVAPDPEVEVLGVIHDENSDITYAGVTVDGEEVLLVDADSDGQFDVACVDANGDGIISGDEMQNISDANLTIDDLNAMSNDHYTAMDDGINPCDDYVDDATI